MPAAAAAAGTFSCQKSARREKNLMCLERKEFRRQLHMFQKWQTENKALRERAKLREMQVDAQPSMLMFQQLGWHLGFSPQLFVIDSLAPNISTPREAHQKRFPGFVGRCGSPWSSYRRLRREVCRTLRHHFVSAPAPIQIEERNIYIPIFHLVLGLDFAAPAGGDGSGSGRECLNQEGGDGGGGRPLAASRDCGETSGHKPITLLSRLLHDREGCFKIWLGYWGYRN